MIILRSKLFGNDAEDKFIDPAVGAVAAGGGIIAGKHLSNKLIDKLRGGTAVKHNSGQVRENLLNYAKKLGIRVEDAPGTGNSFYTGSVSGRLGRKRDAIIRKLGRKGYLKKLNKKLDDKAILKSMNPVYRDIGKDKIYLDTASLDKGGMLSSNATLSHELGHAHYMSHSKGRSKNIVAKAAHRLYEPGAYMINDEPAISKSFKLGKKERQIKVSNANLLSGGFAAHGLVNGFKSAKLKHEGKKESKLHKLASAAIPAALVAPLLVSEGAASLKGLKLLKKAGADKAAMRESRKLLGKAWLTYAGKAAKPVLSGQLGREAGKLAGNAYYKYKDKKNGKDSSKDKNEKTFSRADYAGLSKRAAELLKSQRKAVADTIRIARSYGGRMTQADLGFTPERWKLVKEQFKKQARKEARNNIVGLAGAGAFVGGTGYKIANKIRNRNES